MEHLDTFLNYVSDTAVWQLLGSASTTLIALGLFGRWVFKLGLRGSPLREEATKLVTWLENDHITHAELDQAVRHREGNEHSGHPAVFVRNMRVLPEVIEDNDLYDTHVASAEQFSTVAAKESDLHADNPKGTHFGWVVKKRLDHMFTRKELKTLCLAAKQRWLKVLRTYDELLSKRFFQGTKGVSK